MINNDKEFKEAFRDYAESKGLRPKEDYFCEGMACKDCILHDCCSKTPFKLIEKYEEHVNLLKREISIMSDWKRNRDMNKKLQDFCKTFRSGNNNLSELTCYGLNCNTCPFGGIGNLKEWARRAKAKTEVKRND